MKPIIILVISCLVFLGCTDESNNHSWIRSYNQSLLKGATKLVEETGSKKPDMTVLAGMRRYAEATDELMNLLEDGDKKLYFIALNFTLRA